MSSDFPTDDAEFDLDEADAEFDVSEYDVEFDPEDADPEDPGVEGPGAEACEGDDPPAGATACAYTDYSPGGKDPEDLPATGEDAEGVEERVWDALYEVEDPEMPVSIVDLGLIYGVEVDDGEAPEEPHEGGDSEALRASDHSSGRSPREETAGVHADVEMTLTYTGCPARKMLTEEVEETVAGIEGVESVDLRLVWSPEWSIEMVTEDGKDDLREFGLSV